MKNLGMIFLCIMFFSSQDAVASWFGVGKSSGATARPVAGNVAPTSSTRSWFNWGKSNSVVPGRFETRANLQANSDVSKKHNLGSVSTVAPNAGQYSSKQQNQNSLMYQKLGDAASSVGNAALSGVAALGEAGIVLV